ncbi:lactonase family protein [Maribacter algarum]|nr:lactonase family protein [Maribacter algarum]
MSVIQCSEQKENKLATLFVGTYTDAESEGIYKMQFDSETGKLSASTLAAEITSPSYLAISKEKDFLYAVQEVNDFENGSGAVTGYTLKNDSLTKIQTVSSKGAHPCHLSLSPSEDKLAVANYSGGNASVYNRAADGKLSGPTAIMNHKQIDSTKTPHAHMVKWVNENIYIADLGLDAVLEYKDEDNALTEPSAKLQLPVGAGPRHFTTTENGRFMYVINELNSTITVFAKKDSGEYGGRQKLSTLAPDFEGESFCADIHISPDRRFLYGSNRGENTIVIFAIDKYTGDLALVGRESVHGDWPRNFTIDPTGKFLLVANQKSDNITVFKRDTEKGTLTFLNEEKLSKPVCLVFL